MYKDKGNQVADRRHEAGNAVIVVLVVLMVVAVGALAYLSGQKAGEQKTEGSASIAAVKSSQDSDVAAAAPVAPAMPEIVIEPGNPVVARVSGQDINRLDVFNYVQNLPPEARQMPIQQLFPAVLEQNEHPKSQSAAISSL